MRLLFFLWHGCRLPPPPRPVLPLSRVPTRHAHVCGPVTRGRTSRSTHQDVHGDVRCAWTRDGVRTSAHRPKLEIIRENHEKKRKKRVFFSGTVPRNGFWTGRTDHNGFVTCDRSETEWLSFRSTSNSFRTASRRILHTGKDVKSTLHMTQAEDLVVVHQCHANRPSFVEIDAMQLSAKALAQCGMHHQLMYLYVHVHGPDFPPRARLSSEKKRPCVLHGMQRRVRQMQTPLMREMFMAKMKAGP